MVASLLIQRGMASLAEVEDFLDPSREKLHDPFLMKDMDKAVSRIMKAIERNERIMVYAWQTRAMGLLEQPAQQRPSQRQASPAAAWDTPATHSTKAGRATSVKSEPLTPHGTPAGAAQLASCSSCAESTSICTRA